MSIQAISFPSYYSNLWNYSFHTNVSPRKSLIEMYIPSHFLYTSAFPQTVGILEQLEPRILKTKCFNYRKVPFAEEVKKTESAHLFEHILLEYLCQEQIKTGTPCARFSGTTRWNWRKETKGTFQVTITGTAMTETLLAQALSQTVTLFDTILASRNKRKVISYIRPKQIALDYLFVKRMQE